MEERIKNILRLNPRVKKAVGVVLVLIGFVSLVTPLTPGSWLIFVGLEFLGIRFLVWDKVKQWLRPKGERPNADKKLPPEAPSV